MVRALSSLEPGVRARTRTINVSSVALVGSAIAADVALPAAFLAAPLYVIAVALARWTTPRMQLSVAGLATGGALAASVFRVAIVPAWLAVAQAMLTIAAVWSVVLLLRRFANMERVASRERSQGAHYLDVAEVMIVALDARGVVTMINSKGCTVLGFTREEIIGKHWLEHFVPEDEWPRVQRVFEEVVKGRAQKFRYFENRVRTRAGEQRLVAWHNRAIYEDGHVVATLSSGTDITATRAAERALRVSEQRYRHLFETASDFILVTELSGTVLYANRAWCDAIGEGSRAARRPSVADVLDAPSLQRWRATCEAGRHGEHTDPVELTFVRPDGRQITTEGSLSVRTDGDRPVVVQGILRDVTARHELERMKDEFIAVVSHELRTPLTAIRGALGLLETGVVGEVSEAGRTLARIGRSNSDRLIRLVNDILDLESVVAGGVALNIEPLTANGLVEPALRALASIADEANVALQRDVGVGDDLEFQGDRDRLAQVLTNLLDNAIKFSPPGTSVTVRTQAEGEEHVRICVQDRGPGISKADQQRLFQRFGMLDSSNARKASGTGLGLAISKAIVDLHGGSVGVESAPGKGATFYFSLPRRPLLPELKAADADEPAAAVG